VSAEPFGKRASPGVALPAGGETGPSRRRWKHRGPKPAKTLQREVVQPIRELESESQDGNPGLGMIVAIDESGSFASSSVDRHFFAAIHLRQGKTLYEIKRGQCSAWET
jgi:hypothetical protein